MGLLRRKPSKPERWSRDLVNDYVANPGNPEVARDAVRGACEQIRGGVRARRDLYEFQDLAQSAAAATGDVLSEWDLANWVVCEQKLAGERTGE